MANVLKAVKSNMNYKEYYEKELPSIEWDDGSSQGKAKCPFHQDNNPSLSVDSQRGLFHCFGCGSKGSVIDFQMKRHSMSYPEALESLSGKADRPLVRQGLSETYDYRDVLGGLVFQVVRKEPKGFHQRRPDGEGGWIYNLEGVESIPYNLYEVIQAHRVLITEGEKDAEALRRIGLVASTNPGGAGKWRSSYNQYFKNKEVIILPDNDVAGKNHALLVARNLEPVASSVKIVKLPNLDEKQDVSDWLEKGGDKRQLSILVRATDEWENDDFAVSNDIATNRPLLIPLRDLLDEPYEEMSWLVDDMLPKGGFSVLASRPKVGKSVLARCLALCIAKGKTFLGREVTRGPVIYYSLEERRPEVAKHFREMGALGDEQIFIYDGSTPLSEIVEVQADVNAVKPALIIIDTLFKFARVESVGNYIQTIRALDPLLRLARSTGTHVLSVHHSTKNPKQEISSVLGSTGIVASVDTTILEKRDKYNVRTILTEQRYGKDLEETILYLDETTKTLSIGRTRAEEHVSSIESEIMEVMELHNVLSTEDDILDRVQGSTGPKRQALRNLVKNSRIQRTGSGRKSDPYKYVRFLVHQYSSKRADEKDEVASKSNNDTDECSNKASSEIVVNKKKIIRKKLNKNKNDSDEHSRILVSQYSTGRENEKDEVASKSNNDTDECSNTVLEKSDVIKKPRTRMRLSKNTILSVDTQDDSEQTDTRSIGNYED